jgi:dipeptidyl aminopeptidase/acylaminoacyl peptidase
MKYRSAAFDPSSAHVRARRALRAVLLLVACFVLRAHAGDLQDRFFDNLPLIGQPSSAARSSAVVWIAKERGRNQLWLAAGDPAKARLLYAYPEDDGIPISEVTLSSDGRWVAYVRGTLPNRQGEINNPLDSPDPTERALWLIATNGGVPRRIAGGVAAVPRLLRFSPDGATLAFARGKDVWLAKLSAVPSVERAFTIRGTVGDLSWSPDAQRLAFVSRRGTHSFVGVFALASRSIRYLAPSLDWDTTPVWSRDGAQLAFTRHGQEVQHYRFTPKADANPWSILLADVRSGSVRTLWTADPGAGSALSPLEDGRVLMWCGNGQLLFPWEKTGWRQIYRLDAVSGKVARVSKGEGEVSVATSSADGSTLYYTANATLRERYDLWRTPVLEGEPQRVWADGTPYDLAPVAVGSQGIAFVGERANAPRSVYVASHDATPRLVSPPIAREFPAELLPAPVTIELSAEDGRISHALLYRPLNLRRGQRVPALLYVHGGPTDISAWGVTKYDAKWSLAAVLHGYVVMMVNYRGGIGYGLDFREAPGQGGSGATDLRDVAAAGRYLAALTEVDPARIGIVGQSYGGYLVTAAMARMPELWAAGVSVVGVADWQMELELDSGAPLPFRTSERMRYEDLAYASSANANLERWRAPILFISADDDRDGWLDQAIQLGQSLRRRGVPVEALVEPGGVHGGATHAQLRERVRTALEFLDRQFSSGAAK